MGVGLLIASLPWSLLLGLIPDSFFYSPTWGTLLKPFVFGAILVNAAIIYFFFRWMGRAASSASDSN